jgi:uncharacterized protein (TIGR00255 family)
MISEIRSMTGYGSAENSNNNVSIKSEIRSLNGKFFELNLRMPKYFKEKESEIRQWASNQLKRGTVQISIQVDFAQNNDAGSQLNINTELAKSYKKQLDDFCSALQLSNPDFFNYLIQLPDIIKVEEGHAKEEDIQLMFQTLEKAFQNFDLFRQQEGLALAQELKELNQSILEMLQEVIALDLVRKNHIREKLGKSIADIRERIAPDETRFEYEVLYYLEKIDIQEEISRLKNHTLFFNDSLDKDVSGKKLGFITQEMGREINTLGSKANYYPMQKIVVEMKDVLEKIKEQSLNIL